MADVMQTRVIEHDGLRYRLQCRLCYDGSIQQRHVWFRTQAGEHSPPWVDPWMPSATRKPEVAFRHMTVAGPDPDHPETLLAALRSIAAGHNDARAVAQATLDSYGAFPCMD